MIRGMYQSAAALMAQMSRQIMVSDNLANVTTPGYKAKRTTVGDFREMMLNRISEGTSTPIGALSIAVRPEQPEFDLRQGALVETGRPLDLAIAGPAFFAIQTPDGVQYTRDGSFGLDANRQLVTADGLPVLGIGGPIVIPEGEIRVEPDGTILVDGEAVGQIQMIEFPDDAPMTAVGQNRFIIDAGGELSEVAGISQGFLEQSNVDLNQTMVEMLAAGRSYALAQRMLQVSDSTLGLAVNEIGRIVS